MKLSDPIHLFGHRRSLKEALIMVTVAMLVALLFWGAVAFVVIHAIRKAW